MENVTETRKLINQLFRSQMDASRRLKFHERTVRWWVQYGAPPHVLETLTRLKRGEISMPWARVLMRNKRSRRATDGAKD